jgi:hypothetical protein
MDLIVVKMYPQLVQPIQLLLFWHSSQISESNTENRKRYFLDTLGVIMLK